MFGTPFRRQPFSADAHDLNRSRARNDSKLKTTLERIFQKYNKDFTEVGDEIDLRTGQVIVDNGHIQSMRHENDTGADPTRRFVRAFTQELGAEDHQESLELLKLSRQRKEERHGVTQQPLQYIEVDDSEDELSYTPTRPVPRAAGGRSLHHEATESTSQTTFQRSQASGTGLVPAEAAIDMRPLLETVMSGSSSSRTRDNDSPGNDQRSLQRLDMSAVQSLGLTIANQIAAFLGEQMKTSMMPPMRDDTWRAPTISPRQQPFHKEYSLTPGLTYDTQRAFSPTGDVSLWAPHQMFVEDAVDSQQPRRKKQKIRNTIESDEPIFQPFPGELNPPVHEQDRQESPQRIEEGRQASAAPEDFWWQANRNFNLLAHGTVNRGFLNQDDIDNAPDTAPVDEEFYITARRAPRASGIKNLARFSRREDAMIIRLREREKWGWDEIGNVFPDRSVGSLQVRYSRTLRFTGTRSKRAEIEALVNDDELIASLPDRQWGYLDYSVCGRKVATPRSMADMPLSYMSTGAQKQRKAGSTEQTDSGAPSSDRHNHESSREQSRPPRQEMREPRTNDTMDSQIDPQLLEMSFNDQTLGEDVFRRGRSDLSDAHAQTQLGTDVRHSEHVPDRVGESPPATSLHERRPSIPRVTPVQEPALALDLTDEAIAVPDDGSEDEVGSPDPFAICTSEARKKPGRPRKKPEGAQAASRKRSTAGQRLLQYRLEQDALKKQYTATAAALAVAVKRKHDDVVDAHPALEDAQLVKALEEQKEYLQREKGKMKAKLWRQRKKSERDAMRLEGQQSEEMLEREVRERERSKIKSKRWRDRKKAEKEAAEAALIDEQRALSQSVEDARETGDERDMVVGRSGQVDESLYMTVDNGYKASGTSHWARLPHNGTHSHDVQVGVALESPGNFLKRSASPEDSLATIPMVQARAQLSPHNAHAESFEHDEEQSTEDSGLRLFSMSPPHGATPSIEVGDGSPISSVSSRASLPGVARQTKSGVHTTMTPINRGRQTAAQVRASAKDRAIRMTMLRHSSGSRYHSSPLATPLALSSSPAAMALDNDAGDELR